MIWWHILNGYLCIFGVLTISRKNYSWIEMTTSLDSVENKKDFVYSKEFLLKNWPCLWKITNHTNSNMTLDRDFQNGDIVKKRWTFIFFSIKNWPKYLMPSQSSVKILHLVTTNIITTFESSINWTTQLIIIHGTIMQFAHKSSSQRM